MLFKNKSSNQVDETEAERNITFELTGRGDYIQLAIQSFKLRNTLAALRSNDLLGITGGKNG
jgi:hypothetical protein